MDAFALPANLEKFASLTLAEPAKLMTAKGLAPLQPRDLIICVFAMTLDPSQLVKTTAENTLKNYPENLIKPAIDGGLPAQVLDFFARHQKTDLIQEAVCLSPYIHDETLLFLAATGSTRVVEIISNNQKRLLANPKILDELGNNPLTSPAILDRLLAFLQQEGAIPKDEDMQGQKELSVEEFAATIETFDLPEGLEVPDDLMEDLKTTENMEEEKAKALFARITKMGVMQKIKLAIVGNKEARSILVRDPNKLVSAAVIKSPKIQEMEIVSYSASKTIGDNVLRLINRNREWRRNYQIQFNMATNPKTPQDISIGLLKMLRPNDLTGIAKSKSVPGSIARTAKRMVMAKDNKRS